ncbi:hypothetical protein ACFE04_017775 [Oxalis oulophora]
MHSTLSGDKSMIKKRYMHLTEEILKDNPNMCAYMAPSLDARQDIVVVEVPKLGKLAAIKAIEEWGQPKSKITHLIFCTTSGVDMPGADYQLTKLLGLDPSVKRFMMYQQAAVIIGSDPIHEVEKPLYQIVYATQTVLPDSEGAINGHLREGGLMIHLHKDVSGLISTNIEKSLVEAFKPLGITDWNSIFWIAHPGGPTILDQVKEKLGLDPEKLQATRQVLADYGNMSSACVYFVLDEMRKKSVANGLKTTGEGLDWGVFFGFGPDLTVENMWTWHVPRLNSPKKSYNSSKDRSSFLSLRKILSYKKNLGWRKEVGDVLGSYSNYGTPTKCSGNQSMATGCRWWQEEDNPLGLTECKKCQRVTKATISNVSEIIDSAKILNQNTSASLAKQANYSS